jgi:hypothetical protein
MGQIGASQADLQWIDKLASEHAVTRAIAWPDPAMDRPRIAEVHPTGLAFQSPLCTLAQTAKQSIV